MKVAWVLATNAADGVELAEIEQRSEARSWLQAGSGIPSHTIDRLLLDFENGKGATRFQVDRRDR